MVLELKLPGEVFSQGRAAAVIAEFGPKLAVYALSFLVIAIMLLNHHMLMRAATHATNTLYWWNANLLFWMSLIPLSTAVVGDAPREPLGGGLLRRGADGHCGELHSSSSLRRLPGRQRTASSTKSIG